MPPNKRRVVEETAEDVKKKTQKPRSPNPQQRRQGQRRLDETVHSGEQRQQLLVVCACMETDNSEKPTADEKSANMAAVDYRHDKELQTELEGWLGWSRVF